MLSVGTTYVGGLHGGKNLAQDAVQVFGLVIGDQIGKLINTAGMKLPCPVGASASNSANTPWTLRAGTAPRLSKKAYGRSPDQNGSMIVSDDDEDLTS
jgi:hypothetical protein